MVVSAWRGIKAPKLHAGETPVNSCVAFRVIQLEIGDPKAESATLWTCNSKSAAWVVRLEGLVCILDVEKCGFVIIQPIFHSCL